MRLSGQIFTLTALASFCSAFVCSEHGLLKKFNVDKYSQLTSSIRKTPPSQTEEQWWINICREHTDPPPSPCQSSDVLCGMTKVKLLDNMDNEILTQLIDFPDTLEQSANMNDQGQLVVDFKGAQWGDNVIDAHITFICASTPRDHIVTWQDKQINVIVEGSAGCVKDHKEDPDENHGGNVKHGSSVGSWFLWLVTYALLFALIYLLATSYMSTRGGNFQEFREEFVERSTSLAGSLPQFAREVASKVLGRGSSSQRGGYSAV